MFRPLCLALCLIGSMGAATARSAPPEDAITKHAKMELEVARKGLAEAERVAPGMIADSAEIWVWSRRVLQSELTLCTTKSERIAALEAHLRRALKLEKMAANEYRQGRLRSLDLLETIYRRHEVEVQLAEEKAKPESLYH